MKYTVTVGGESHRCQLFVGFVGKPEDDATPADLIAALKANAAACGEVMAAMGWVTDQALAVTGERASQAERSLATVTAERDEARAAHATASRLCDEAQARADRALGITPGERDALRSRLAKHVHVHGSGSGHVHGDGSGDGSGDGHGDGSGHVHGHGHGDG